ELRWVVWEDPRVIGSCGRRLQQIFRHARGKTYGPQHVPLGGSVAVVFLRNEEHEDGIWIRIRISVHGQIDLGRGRSERGRFVQLSNTGGDVGDDAAGDGAVDTGADDAGRLTQGSGRPESIKEFSMIGHRDLNR